MTSVCVLLPAFNEAAGIASLIARIKAVTIEGVALSPLVVDDGSRDETAALARAAGAEVLSHPKNRGVGAAFRTGRDWAWNQGVEFIVHMDSDGQLLPEELPRLIAPVIRGEADLASGSRFLAESKATHLERKKALALSAVARGVGLLTGTRLTDLSCGFRCMNRKVLQAVSPSYDYDYIQETLIQALAARARIVEVPVTALYPEDGKATGMSRRTLRYGSRFLGLTGLSLLRFYRTRLLG
jgi:glycosyltransferase involved in cell wall biosynthesis